MDITRSRFSRIVRLSAAAAVVIIVAGYAGYRSLPYMRGPSIEIFQPISGSSSASATTTVIGKVSRVNSLLINGNIMQIDESGNFKDTFAIFPGINVIAIEASDQFGRSTKEVLRIFGARELQIGRTGTSTQR